MLLLILLILLKILLLYFLRNIPTGVPTVFTNDLKDIWVARTHKKYI